MNCVIAVWTIMYFQPIVANDQIAIKHLINYIQQSVSLDKVNVLVESFDDLSPIASKIVHETNENFVSRNTDHDGIVRMTNNSSLTDRPADDEYAIRRISERLSLTMGIVDSKNKSNLSRDMKKMLLYFTWMSPYTRGKFILNVITDSEMNPETLLRFANSQKFLDLTIIEWITRNETRGINIDPFLNRECRVIVHSFNPFSEIFNKTMLSPKTELFPDKTRDFYGFPLIVKFKSINSGKLLYARNDSSGISYHGTDIDLIKLVAEVSNSSLHTILPDKLKRYIPIASNHDVSMPFLVLFNSDRDEDMTENRATMLNLNTIKIPGGDDDEYYFYIMRKKIYTEKISVAAIIAFAALFLTAAVFKIWSYILGFKIRNWSFLNIVTAQMGGSLEVRGTIKLSEMIFQMSIYVATFIIVTIGGDYMFHQMFVLRQDLPEIRTIEAVADSQMPIILSKLDFQLLGMYANDATLKKIYDRSYVYSAPPGTRSFCESGSLEDPFFVESINCCILGLEPGQEGPKSNNRFQIDKIPISIFIGPSLIHGKGNSFFRNRIEELTKRFSEVGLISKTTDDSTRSLEYEIRSKKVEFEQKSGDEETVPLYDQLRPVLTIGYILGVIALIGEFIWRRMIEHTEFGKLVTAFYSQYR
ncbi:hypothetical protein QAD02_018096 [Eretmocerus hayati]|uniref:Uncharacterized protein n=1 Tax=Eretmocerus hayati TaxID=131215 RepID=A0ACC2PG81_9HYME|nr:hypothetical protein QAD02_018096 [Eretmocerus hayati]